MSHRQAVCRRGVVLVQVALMLTVLLGFVALSADAGLLLSERRHGQATADAAALAAASDLYAKYLTNKGVDTGGTAKAAALSVASANGYTNNTTTSVVSVRTSGQTYSGGANAGKTIPAGYVEVAVQFNQPRGFSQFLMGSTTQPVTARAVARGQAVPFSTGILTLDPSAPQAFSGSGNALINVSKSASIVVDSSNADAAAVAGNGDIVAGSITVTGKYEQNGNGTFSPTPTTGAAPTADPLAYLPAPSTSSLATQSNSQLVISGNTTTTLSPGVYKGGISISGNATVTLSGPGIYYMQGGGFVVAGNANITGNGIMIYNAPNTASDQINIAGNGDVSITAMTTGIYQGISIFEARNSTVPINLAGNGVVGTTQYTGTVYAADAQVNLAGNGVLNTTQIIARSVLVAGNGTVNVNYSSSTTGLTRLVGLVE